MQLRAKKIMFNITLALRAALQQRYDQQQCEECTEGHLPIRTFDNVILCFVKKCSKCDKRLVILESLESYQLRKIEELFLSGDRGTSPIYTSLPHTSTSFSYYQEIRIPHQNNPNDNEA